MELVGSYAFARQTVEMSRDRHLGSVQFRDFLYFGNLQEGSSQQLWGKRKGVNNVDAALVLEFTALANSADFSNHRTPIGVQCRCASGHCGDGIQGYRTAVCDVGRKREYFFGCLAIDSVSPDTSRFDIRFSAGGRRVAGRY